ncbi:Tyrosine kinase receptor Cad96Ca [Stylophora pistillata]|uniref:Tyrosine kinase receptor Cad96Ca n=1 Tax=Stylophora pistillata TaxID=50429 RepID=A0A2B4R3I4_STYPI|nr:Tyrosine kinase receptor Cad96Ca [Stylophora pistillata]
MTTLSLSFQNSLCKAGPKGDISGTSNLIIEGNSVNLTCEIVAGRPEPEITWLKKNTLQENSWSLLFPKIKKNDEGWYTCKAENAAGIFTKCVQISGKDIYTQWNKKESELTIAQVLEEDGGKYSCEGRNKLGKFVLLPIFSPDQEQAIQMEPLNVEVDGWEIEVSRVLPQEVIGRGALGAVWRALLCSPNGRPGNRTVAAKCFTLHSILIMEYIPCGDLLGYLRKCRGVRDPYYLGEGRTQDLTNYDLVMFAKQIAAGMMFLGSRGTYEELLDLGAYEKKKYSRVEDLGEEDAGPGEEVAKKAAAKRLGKWSSARR